MNCTKVYKLLGLVYRRAHQQAKRMGVTDPPTEHELARHVAVRTTLPDPIKGAIGTLVGGRPARAQNISQ